MTGTPQPKIPSARRTTQLRRNLTLCTAEGFVAMPICFLVLPGNFIVAMLLTQTFRLTDSIFGLIVSLPSWCNVVQLFLLPFLSRRWGQKKITVIFASLNLLSWVALGVVLPWIPRSDIVVAGNLFFVLFLVSSVSQALMGVSWTSWVQEWIPARLRGRFFGQRNRLLQISTVLFLLGAGTVLGFFQNSNPILGFQIVVFSSVFLRVFSIWGQVHILSTEGAEPSEKKIQFRKQLDIIRRSTSMKSFYFFGAIFGFAANMFAPFFNVFMYRVLHMNIQSVTTLTVITTLTGALSMPAWAQLLDKYGNRAVIFVSLVLWAIPGYLWMVVTPGNTWLLRLIYGTYGIFQAGYVLGIFNILLKLVPVEAKTTAISLNVAITSLTTAIGPILGGMLLDAAWAHGFNPLRTYHNMAFIHHTLIVVTGVLLLRIPEPKASRLRQVVGAMRSFRQVGALLGMSFLVNFTFFKSRR